MRGETETHREDAFCMRNHFQCLRTRTPKVIVNHNDCVERYDLVNDPNESTNIVGGNSATGGPLRSRIQQRLTEAKWRR